MSQYRGERGLAPYTFHLYDQAGVLRDVRSQSFAHDDDAIDHAGRLDHPHEIQVRQEDRLVARFPPVRPELR